VSDLTVYDKAKWHYQHETFPADLDERQGHIYGGFFLAWLASRLMFSEEFLDDCDSDVESLRRHDITPGEVYAAVGGVLMSEMLTDEGNAFATYCFESDRFDYYGLFEEVLAGELESPYYVADSWDNYHRLAAELDTVYEAWRAAGAM
jgi:hypothetical protein